MPSSSFILIALTGYGQYHANTTAFYNLLEVRILEMFPVDDIMAEQ